MTTQETNRTAWEEARQLVAACLPHLPQRARIHIGPYLYQGWEYLSFVFDRETDGGRTVVGFGLMGGREESNFLDLSTISKTGEVWDLHPNGITQEFQNQRRYPHFSFGWIGRNPEPTLAGKLWHVRVDFTGPSHIIYSLGGEAVFRSGKRALEMPDKLEGSDLLGKELPWQIDYAAKGEEVLASSQLREFAEAAQKLPRLK